MHPGNKSFWPSHHTANWRPHSLPPIATWQHWTLGHETDMKQLTNAIKEQMKLIWCSTHVKPDLRTRAISLDVEYYQILQASLRMRARKCNKVHEARKSLQQGARGQKVTATRCTRPESHCNKVHEARKSLQQGARGQKVTATRCTRPESHCNRQQESWLGLSTSLLDHA